MFGCEHARIGAYLSHHIINPLHSTIFNVYVVLLLTKKYKQKCFNRPIQFIYRMIHNERNVCSQHFLTVAYTPLTNIPGDKSILLDYIMMLWRNGDIVMMGVVKTVVSNKPTTI